MSLLLQSSLFVTILQSLYIITLISLYLDDKLGNSLNNSVLLHKVNSGFGPGEPFYIENSFCQILHLEFSNVAIIIMSMI